MYLQNLPSIALSAEGVLAQESSPRWKESLVVNLAHLLFCTESSRKV